MFSFDSKQNWFENNIADEFSKEKGKPCGAMAACEKRCLTWKSLREQAVCNGCETQDVSVLQAKQASNHTSSVCRDSGKRRKGNVRLSCKRKWDAYIQN